LALPFLFDLSIIIFNSFINWNLLTSGSNPIFQATSANSGRYLATPEIPDSAPSFSTRIMKASSGTPSYSHRIQKRDAGTKPKVG
jgi:hypothetical protein